ncbi:hypothetical protein F4802DRAFT_553058 [Xylaria palmicola]|nr:hypothetical protein F4802DRAFT_553058 [Xylaria palmicola]
MRHNVRGSPTPGWLSLIIGMTWVCGFGSVRSLACGGFSKTTDATLLCIGCDGGPTQRLSHTEGWIGLSLRPLIESTRIVVTQASAQPQFTRSIPRKGVLDVR